jgi:WD40 repeat protein
VCAHTREHGWPKKNGRADDSAGHTDSVTCARFNKDGKLVATAGLDACVKIWNTENGELLKTLEGPGEGLDVRLSLPLSLSRARALWPNDSSFNPPPPFVPSG